MKPQDNYYVMIGRRYLRWAQGRDAASLLSVARVPTEDCALPTRELANELALEVMRAAGLGSKHKVTVQRITIKELAITPSVKVEGGAA